MAVTIVRTPWIDDDGSGTTGTVLNNAIKTELYSQIDGALAQLVASNGLLNITAFGVHQITGSGAGAQTLQVTNSQTTGDASVSCTLQAGSTVGGLLAYNQTSADGGYYGPSKTLLIGQGTGGLSIAATQGSGAIRFYTGGATQRAIIEPDGRWGINGPAIINATFGVNSQGGRTAMRAEAQADGFPAMQGISTSNTLNGFVAHFTNTGSGTGLYIANTAAWQATSDRQLKTDIRDLDALDGLRHILPRDFLFRSQATSDTPTRRNFGFVAQEVAPLFPDLIRPGPDGLLTMEYTGMIAPLVQGWQDHDRRLARLESLAERT